MQWQTTCMRVPEWVVGSNLHPSAAGRDEHHLRVHLPRARLHHAQWSSRKIARSVGAWWRLRCKAKMPEVPGRCAASTRHHTRCHRQRRARTSCPLAPCTVEQPQYCSTSRSLMAAPLQRRTPACAWQGGKHTPPVCSFATSWRLHCKDKTPSCRCLVGAASTRRPSAADRDEHAPRVCLQHAPWSSRKLARPVGA